MRLRAGRAVGAAAIVLLCGFVTMAVFNQLTAARTGLPDLYTFLSATWGDGVALPLMVGSLVLALSGLESGAGERLASFVGGAVGGLVGLYTQLSWLTDGHPRLNWTLPRVHHLDAAGVYHGVFLVAMSALTATLWVRLATRLVRARMISVGVGVAAGTALVAGVGFAFLLLADTLPGRRTAADTSTIMAIGLALVLLIVAAVAVSLRRRPRPSARHPVAGFTSRDTSA